MSKRPASKPKMGITVVLIQPTGYVHSAALAELAETVLYGLNALGADFDLSINEIPSGRKSIIIGAHLLDEASMNALPRDVIIYNSEQIDEQSSWLSTPYRSLLKSRVVWDYSQANVRRLVAEGAAGAVEVAVGYVPQLTRIPPAQEDIDVLFYGSLNERRRQILEQLIQRGLKVEVLSGVYREDRDRYIARAKVILNMHYYDACVFEIVRVSYLLANEKTVVSECGALTSIDADIRDAVCAVPYEQLVNACVNLAADHRARTALARRGLAIFRQRDEARILAQALDFPRPESAQKGVPALLNLGSGKDWRDDCLNVDINESVRPDALLDIGIPLQERQILATQRFGNIELHANMFDVIVANDVLEHIPDLVCAMENCLRLLKPGGHFLIYVPYDLSLGAWQDPTHLRAFNENSWLYYTDWYWYLGWSEARFDRISTEFRLSAFGQALVQAGKPLDEILRTPRAVDGMSVNLRKRYLLESEAHRSQVALQRPWDTVPTNGNGQ